MANRSPPMPFETGSIKPSVAFAAIAASTALPPRFKISTPTSVAAGTLVQTIPCRARTSDRVAKLFPVMRSIWPLSRRSTINRANSPRLTGLIQRTTQLTSCFQKRRRHPFRDCRRSPLLPNPGLVLHRVMQFFSGIHHVLMRLLDGIELLLLILIEQWTDLRQRAVHHRFCFLHRLLMNGGDLRFGLIKDRLKLRLLVRCQIQLLSDSPKTECLTVTAPESSVAGARLCLHDHKAAKRNRTGGHNC